MDGRRSPADRRRAVQHGADGEARVADELCARAWSVVARRWRGGGGELDLVVQKGDVLRFVEVKVVQPDDLRDGEWVSAPQRRRLRQAADAFLMGWPGPVAEACFLLAIVDGDALRWMDDPF